MSKNTGTSELINYFDLGVNGDVGISGNLTLSTIVNAVIDTDKFLVSDNGIIKYRTGAELLSDIGSINGTGTTNYIPKFTGGTTLGDSLIYDNGSTVLIGTTTAPTPVTGVSFPLSITSSQATRVRVDSSRGAPNYANAGVGLYASGVQKWSFAHYSTDSGANYDFTIYNDALTSSAILVKGSNSNVLIGSTVDNGARLQVSGNATITGSTNQQLVLDFTTASGGFTWQSFRLNGTNRYRIFGNTDNSFTLYSDILSANVLSIASTGAATFSSSVTTATFLRASSGVQSNPTGGASVAIDYQSTADLQGRIRSRDWDGAAWKNLTLEANNIILSPSGSVGIGTQSPLALLTVGDGATQQQPYLALSRNSLGGFWAGIRWYDGNTIKSVIQEDADFNLRFSTSNTERMRITSNGNVGIGTTSPYPNFRLHVNNAGNTGFFLSNTSNDVGGYLFAGGLGGLEIQSVDSFNSTAKKLMLQPYGGNVLIGTTTVSVSEKFKVSGTALYNGVARFENSENQGDVNHGIINLVNTKTHAIGNDASIMFSAFASDASMHPRASIGMKVSSAGVAGDLVFNTRSDSNYTEKMRITSGGDVNFSGGAVRADGGYFQVRTSGGSAVSGYLLREAAWLGTGTSTNLALAAENAGGELVFFTGGQTTTRMKITSSGNVLIGTTTDNGARLQVSGGIVSFNNGSGQSSIIGTTFTGFEYTRGSTLFGFIGTENTASGGMRYNSIAGNFEHKFYNNSNLSLTLASTGAATFSSSVTATSFITSSDLRLKEVIEKDGDLAVYKRKGEEQIHYGYIAQEMQESYPNQVHEAQDGYLSLNYVEILVKKVNELEKKIKQLEK